MKATNSAFTHIGICDFTQRETAQEGGEGGGRGRGKSDHTVGFIPTGCTSLFSRNELGRQAPAALTSGLLRGGGAGSCTRGTPNTTPPQF